MSILCKTKALDLLGERFRLVRGMPMFGWETPILHIVFGWNLRKVRLTSS